MPGDTAAGAVDEIKDPAGEWQPLGAHHGRDRRNPPLERELDLRLVLVFRRKRHCQHVAIEDVAAEAGHTAPNV